MFETFLQVFAGCSRLGQTAALQHCIRLWELQRPGREEMGVARLGPGCLLETETSARDLAWILQGEGQ